MRILKIILIAVSLVLANCDVILATTKTNTVWNYMNGDVIVVMGIVVLTLVVSIGGMIAEVANQAKVKYYLQIVLGISIVVTIIGYFIKAMVGLTTVATGKF